MRSIQALVLLLVLLSGVAWADDKAPNIPYVAASKQGRCYAKAVPSELRGEHGVTKVFMVEEGEDRLVHTFDWYSKPLYLECFVSAPGKPVAVSVVRFGPWHRGDRASDKDLALAFYWGGEQVARYSTLDIAGSPENVGASVSHYSFILDVPGYHWQRSNDFTFEIVASDGRHLFFDAGTGRRVEPGKEVP